jgi:hypothetical protein
MTRGEQVAAMLRLIPADVRPEQIARLETWELERLSLRAGFAESCTVEAHNDLIQAVWVRGTYRSAGSAISSRPTLLAATPASSSRSGGAR